MPQTYLNSPEHNSVGCCGSSIGLTLTSVYTKLYYVT